MMTKQICKNFEKEKGEKHCKNFLGFAIVGEEKEIAETCKNRCKLKIKEV